MKNSTYAQFEDEHRGSPISVSSKLNVYKPLLVEFKKDRPDARLIDLGCGRGEFLKIATELSIDSLGIDSNEEMLASIGQPNLKLEKADVLEYLKKQENSSFDILTAFHLVEHFSSDYLLRVVNEIKRVLRPGGLTIIETPNPENIIVSTCNFYMDMTHVKPLPPQLLKFIFQNLKFNYVNLWGLNSKKKLSTENVALIDILGGVSPDYALLALKNCKQSPSSELLRELNVTRGNSLNELASLYEKRWSGEIIKAENKINKSQDWVNNELNSIKQELSYNLVNLHSEIQGMHQEIRAEIESINEQAHFYQTELQRVTNSRSWRITFPLRYAGKIFRKSKSLLRNFFFDFKNLPSRVFFKNYRAKIVRKLFPQFLKNKFVNKLNSTNSFMSLKEKKFLAVLEKTQKEK